MLVIECVQLWFLLPISDTSVDQLGFSCFQKPPVVAPKDMTSHFQGVDSLPNCPKLVNLDLGLVELRLFSAPRRITLETKGPIRSQMEAARSVKQLEDKSN